MKSRRAQGVIVAGIGAIVLGLLAVATSSVEQWLVGSVEASAEEIGFPLAGTKLRLDPSSLKVSVEGLDYDASDQHIQVGRLDIEFPWDALRDGGIRVSSVEADRVSIAIRSDEKAAATPSGGDFLSGLPDIRIDRLAVQSVAFSYSTPTFAVNAPSVSIEARRGVGEIRFGAPVSIASPSPSTISLETLPFAFEEKSVRFGPSPWRLRHAGQEAKGSAEGVVRWAPEFVVDARIESGPLSFRRWKGIRAQVVVSYARGVLDLSEFRIRQGKGNVVGVARMSPDGGTVDAMWSNVSLAPVGAAARSDGTMRMKWTASDFGDLAGEALVDIRGPQLGNSRTRIRVANRKADVDVRADVSGFKIRATVSASMGPLLAGDFNRFQGTLQGTVESPTSWAHHDAFGTVRPSATWSLRNSILALQGIRIESEGAVVSNAALRVDLAGGGIQGAIPQARIELHELSPEAAGTVDLSADIGGSIQRPTARFMASAPRIHANAARIENAALSGLLAIGPSGAPELDAVLGATVEYAPPSPPSANTAFGAGVGPAVVSANASLRDNVFKVENVQVNARASRISDAVFEVDLKDRSIRGAVPNAVVDLSDVDPTIHGIVGVAAGIGGTIDHPKGAFSAHSLAIDVKGVRVDSASVEGSLDNDILRLDRFEARKAEGTLKASGQANLASEEISADVELDNLRITEVSDLSTTATLNAHVEGTFRSPEVAFAGNLRDVVFRGIEHGHVHIEGNANPEAASLVVESAKYAANVQGLVDLRAPYAFTGVATASGTRYRYGEYDLVADGSVLVSGAASPLKMDLVEFRDLKVATDGIRAQADGSLESGVRVDAKVDFAKLPVDEVELRGTAAVSAVLRGNLSDPWIDGSLATDGATVRAAGMQQPASVSASVDFAGQDFSIRTLQADYLGATATISGAGSWRGESRLQFRVENILLENLASGRQIYGNLAIEGGLNIHARDLKSSSGYATVTKFDAMVRELEIHQVQPIQIELADETLAIRQFEIDGPETRARVTGSADLRNRSLNFDADAETDLAILELFASGLNPSGTVRTRVTLRGTMDQPLLDGNAVISQGEVAIEEPDLLLSEVEAEAHLRGDRIEIVRATGVLNGGMFMMSGGTGFSGKGLRDTALKLSVQRGVLEYPEGFQAEFSSELSMDGSTPNLVVSGRVDMSNGIYEKDFHLTRELLGRVSSASSQTGIGSASSVGDQIGLDVVVTAPSIQIKNNVADLDALGSFTVRGTASKPIILGRVLVQEGGELYFGPAVSSQAVQTKERGDRYTIEHGSIDFNNPVRTEPDFDFRATHEMDVDNERYEVTLEITGTPETLKAELTSDPPLEQSDIVAMLLTGRSVEELQGEYATVAGEQAFSYVSGQLSQKVLSQAGSKVGLNTVRIDPVAVANQTDLAARITIAKEFASDFSLVYSQNLNGATGQTWILAYEPLKNFLLRAINDADKKEALVDLKHELKFGGGPPLRARSRKDEPKLRNVAFAGTNLSFEDLRKHVAKVGSSFDTYQASRDSRELRQYLSSRGFPSARVQAEQHVENRSIDVRFDISEGPKVLFEYIGADIPSEVQAEVRQVWSVRGNEETLLRSSTRRLLRHLRSEGYLQARVFVESRSEGGVRRHIFQIDRATRFDRPVPWVFQGVEPIEIPEPAGVVMENHDAVKERIESHFRSNGYLDAMSTVPKLVIAGNKAHFDVVVDQGAKYSVEKVEFEGNQALDAEQLGKAVKDATKKQPSEGGMALFTSTWLDMARQRITSEYWKQGFNDVQVVPSAIPDRAKPRVVVRFAISEGAQQIIEGIDIAGDDKTDLRFIESKFAFKEGDPVDLTKVNLTRKKLYDTGIFKRVEIEMAPGATGYIAKVRLNEGPPWRLGYGVGVTHGLQSGDESVGLTGSLAYANLFGIGITGGASAKLNADERDARVFGSLPELFGRDVTTSLTVFRTRDLSDPNELFDYAGATIQQQWKFREHYIFSYDYSYRKVRTSERDEPIVAPIPGPVVPSVTAADPFLDNPRIPIARFNTSISRDTRDDILNATRGTFMSNSFDIAPPGIGSSITYLRNYTQYLRFQRFGRIVWASGLRFGVAKGLNDQDLDSSLQFRTGGSTTVRAFKQDELTPLPGNFEVVLNQEVRFPVFWRFHGAAFVDAGQVGVRSSDLGDWRWGPGLGLRIVTPFVLVRTDVGFNVKPRVGEPQIRWWFGIGQAF